MERVRIVRHSIGPVQFMKFLLPASVTPAEVTAVFQCMALDCLERGMRGALLVDNDRPAMGEADFRLAVVAFRKPAYRAYLTALASLPRSALHTALFWDELDAMAWLRQQFPEESLSSRST
jgi:hypothetical protein